MTAALSSLPNGAIRAVGYCFFLICLVAVACMVRAFGHAKAARPSVIIFPAALVSFVVVGFLGVYSGVINRVSEPRPVCEFVVSLPVWVFAAAGLLSAGLIVAALILLERTVRSELSALSVCEGLDQLPDGICVSLPNGFPRLVNDRMQNISNAAFGENVLDTQKLERRFAARDFRSGCEADERDKNLFLRLPDDSVWQIKRRKITVGKKEMDETIAFDVTQWYFDMLDLEQRNERLSAVNERIRAYNRDMDRIVREKEILAAKIRLHGDLGRCLLSLQRYLNDGGIDRSELTTELYNTASLLLRNEAQDQGSEDRMNALYEAAKAVDVEIRLCGEIPPEKKELVETAIHECLTNTVKHANGHLLELSCTHEGGAFRAVFTNDGKLPDGPIAETGGLKDLRTLVERKGGRMTVESEPVFRLVLDL